jgi:hypothetical protein
LLLPAGSSLTVLSRDTLRTVLCKAAFGWSVLPRWRAGVQCDGLAVYYIEPALAIESPGNFRT